MSLVLASTSAARRAMLASAGVPHEAMAPQVDETAIKLSLVAENAAPHDIADALAEVKAIRVSSRAHSALVLGADQVLTTHDGQMLDKPASRVEAAMQLKHLRGRSHSLISAAVIALDGKPIWRVYDKADLTMRNFSDAFLDDYLDREWPAIGGCVGAYRLEDLGIQLFSRIRGDHFTILGLPLLQVLDFLRVRGELAS